MKEYTIDRSRVEDVGRQLLERIAHKDDAALGEFYDRYSRLVYSFVLKVLRSQNDAEEITADVFWQVWRQAESYNMARGSVAAWLITIARSRAIDRRRALERRGGETEIDLKLAEDAGSSADPEVDVYLKETRSVIECALGELNEKQRQIVELAYFKGLSQSEISELLHEPLGTVKTRSRAAMQFLRERLKRYFR